MTPEPALRAGWRALLAPLAASILIAGCASAPPATPPAAAPSAPAPAPAAAAPEPAPAPPPAPELSPAAAKAQAQKLALEAVDQLQNGDEPAARATLERAAQLDPGNELARKLGDQIRADAQRELGSVYFRYTVQKDDTLSKLAQQFLGDRFRFYILAKYNDIANPSRVAAGQVIRIPGRAPPPAAAALPPDALVVPPAPAAAPARAADADAKPRDDVAEALKKVAELQAAGNLEAAYFAYTDLAQRYPASAEAAKRRDASRAALLRSLDREASTAFQRQNLDLAIAKWDRILEIDPDNRKARLERERAQDLKRKLAAKQGAR
jgi:tetratricopeptide (TPR) repeat protein